MKNRKHRKWKRRILTMVSAVTIIIFVAVVYIKELNQTVSNNIIQNISELAEHDQNNISSNIKATWQELEYLKGKIISYHCKTIEALETQMNVECINSSFSHIYMVSEDGKVYTDKFVTYDPSKKGQNGRIDLLPYFDSDTDYIVDRFDDKVAFAGVTKESILYGIRLENFTVDGIKMVGLVSISDIGNIQDRLTIDSFMKDGVSRGYSAVIDMDGNYIVNVDREVYLNDVDNFFERIDQSRKSELSRQDIKKKMENNETFNFYYTDTDKVERIVYGIPFAEKGIQWYFLSSVESTVFTDQNRTFLVLSMAMLGGIVIVIIVALLLMMSFQNKAITAKAEAKARSAFLANMSHEIRTPLNGILGLIYLIEKDIDNKEDDNIIKKRLDKTKETADYLLSLINNILDISKLEAGKVELQKESISLELIMDSIRSMQKNNIESRGIRFIVEKEMLAPWIIGDDVQIKRVLMNIVGNASKFTSPGGEIRFSVTQEKEDEQHVTTIFTCADTGCGMSEGFLEHIWDSFSQERRNNDESIKGTGLGMAISKTLMDAMGGSITVESKLGEGSTFTVILHSEIGEAVIPYKKENEEHLEKLPEKNKQAKILVAEDNELNAEILIEILEGEGFEVDHAQNGQIAIEKFRDSAVGEYKVILMDMQMPVMDGCEATQGIRAMNREDADKITIFACTANNFHEDREKAIMSGMNDFLAKPVDVHILLQKLEGIRFVY